MTNLLNSSSLFTRVSRNYYTYLIYLYAFLLPLPNNLKSIALILLILTWAFSLPKPVKPLKGIFENRIIVAFLTLYLLYLLSFFYSENKSEAIDFLVLQISIPVLPFVFYGRLTKRQVIKACLIFSFSIALVSLYALYKTYTLYFPSFNFTTEAFANTDWAYFSFTLPISINFHAPYFSLYMCTGLLILVYGIKLADKGSLVRLLYSLIILYFLVFIALLSSRTAFFATIGVIAIVSSAYLLKAKKPVITGILLLSIATLSFVIFKNIPYLYSKTTSSAGFSERLTMWSSALNIIQDNPVFGVGVGDRKDQMLLAYQSINFENGIRNNYNAHNQYLDTTIFTGILGLLVLTSSFFLLLKHSITNKRLLLLSFVSVFMLCCLTESLLNRQRGVMLFSFFCALLAFNNRPENTASYPIQSDGDSV